jgi:hypothetical protein
MAYEIEWSQSAKTHLRRLSANHRRMVEDAVRRHLTNDAERDAGARKRTRPTIWDRGGCAWTPCTSTTTSQGRQSCLPPWD